MWRSSRTALRVSSMDSKTMLTPSRKAAKTHSYAGGACRGGQMTAALFCGSQGGPCDPTTKNDAGGTPASKLLSDYRKRLPENCGSLCQALPTSTGPAWAGTNPRLSGVPVQREEAECAHSRAPHGSVTILFLQDAEASIPG